MSTIADNRPVLAISTFVFAASAAATVLFCRSMSGGMPMSGGWTMSMAWMRMPGQSWLAAAGSFMAMWLVMMIAMMMPSLAPSLAASHRASSLIAAGYFFVWMMIGLAVYPLGIMIASAEMRSPARARAAPIATGVIIALAGLLQLTRWKAQQLAACRNSAECSGGWRHGVRLGVRCALCCSGFMTVLLVAGVMDLRAMGVITAAITAERLAPKPMIVARAAGIAVVLAGSAIAGAASL